MNLGVGGISNQSSGISNSSSNQAQTISNEINALKTDLTILVDELSAGQSTLGTKQADQNQSQQGTSHTQSKQTEQTSNQHIPEEALAAFISDEEDKKVKKRKKSKLDEKLEMLMGLESLIMDAEIEDEDDRAAVEQFFNNMTRIRNMRGRLKQLEETEKRYEEQLENQDSESELNQVSEKAQSTPNKRPDTLPSHIQFQERSIDDIVSNNNTDFQDQV